MTAKLTKNQSLVHGVLESAKAPLGAYDILDQLRDDGFKAPLQVYRALDKLLELHMIHRLDSLNAFVVCRHDHNKGASTVAFAICEDCGVVTEFEDEKIRTRLNAWANDHDFTPHQSTIELRGLCTKCG